MGAMKPNAEFTEDVGLVGFGLNGVPGTMFTRSALVNEKMLRMTVDMNKSFIRNTGTEVTIPGNPGNPDLYIDIREAGVRDMVEWFEKTIRDWVAAR